MVDWHSPNASNAAREVFIKLLHGYLGLYAWEILTSLDFEWDVVTRRRVCRWPLACYFLNRYCTLAALISALIMFDGKRADCRGIFIISLFLIHFSLTLASLNFAIRTIAIWNQNRMVVASVALCVTAHCFISVYQAATASIFNVPGIGCFPSSANYSWDLAIYVFSLAFDALTLGLNFYKFRTQFDRKNLFRTSTITHIILRQGLIYFIIAFLVNIIAIVFLVLNLNIGTIGGSTCFASTVCTVVACRSVRSLSSAKPDENTFTQTGDLVDFYTYSNGTQPISARPHSIGTFKGRKQSIPALVQSEASIIYELRGRDASRPGRPCSVD